VETNKVRGCLTAAGVLLALVLATPAAAQGRGNAFGKGRQVPISPTVTTPDSSSASGAGIGIRQFGTWLDDATLGDPGTGWVAMSLGSYFSPVGHQTDFPVLDGAYGLTRKVQFGATVPYSRFSAADGGGTASGRGDVYLSAKVGLFDDTAKSGMALAITPLVEILSNPDPVDGGRFSWALPVSTEVRMENFRLYGSGGYFSRGAVFGGGAVEVPATDRLVATTALVWTRSLVADPVADALGLGKSRVDITCGAAYALNSSFAVFGSVGRTLSRIDANSATMVLSTGLALSFAGRSPTPPSRPR